MPGIEENTSFVLQNLVGLLIEKLEVKTPARTIALPLCGIQEKPTA